MNGKTTPIVRINPYNDIDSWVTAFNEKVSKSVAQPEREICADTSQFSDWRLSYGVMHVDYSNDNSTPIYFLAFYPPFCIIQKALYHYQNVSQLAKDVLILENFLVGVNIDKTSEVDAQDIIACTFSILRQKESIELFQEQKYLMDFGLQHYHLDNYYQDLIKGLVSEYQDSKCIVGKALEISLFNMVGFDTGKDEDKSDG